MRRALFLVALAPTLVFSLAAQAGSPPADYVTLANGATLIVSEQHNVPIVAVQVILDAGARRDSPDKAGVASLTAELLTEGTTKRSATEISDAVDFLGASLSAGAATDYASVGLSVLKKDLPAGLDLLTDVLLHPKFAAAEIHRRREAVLASIRAAEDDPGTVAQKAFQRELFAGEPYGHPVEGTLESVPRIERADIAAFYRQHYRPGGAIIAVVGDVSAGAIRARLEAALAGWSGSGEPFHYPAATVPRKKLITIDKPVTQANIILGERGVARDNPDYYAITVMNYILGGGGFSSRLLDDIRTQAGLAYSVASFFTVNKSPGSFQVTMQTKNASAAEAIKRARAAIERIRRQAVKDEELSEAKRYLTGSFPLRLDSDRKIVGFLSQVEFYGLGRDYADTYADRINAVTKDDVLRVAKRYIDPAKLLLVVVGDLAQVPLAEIKSEVSAPAAGTETEDDRHE